jgi:hypothetical protein
LKIRNLPCLIKNPPLKDLPTREAESFSPLALGLSMTIDYGRRKRRSAALCRRSPRTSSCRSGSTAWRWSAAWSTAAWPRRSSSIRAAKDFDQHRDGRGALETGDSQDSAEVTARRVDRDAFLLPGIDLDFNQIQYRNFPVVVLNLRAPSVLLGFQVGGIVGHKFLSKYRVAVDLERSVLRLKTADARTSN